MASDGARALEERAAWRENASQLPTESLVFLDECGSNIALTPLYARAPKGERARGKVPRNRGKNMTLMAALSLEGMGAAMILEGSADTIAFELYVEQILAPNLRTGQIVIMDNLRARHVRTGQAGDPARKVANSFSRPRYSPDLSPIARSLLEAQDTPATSRSQNQGDPGRSNWSRAPCYHNSRRAGLVFSLRIFPSQ